MLRRQEVVNDHVKDYRNVASPSMLGPVRIGATMDVVSVGPDAISPPPSPPPGSSARGRPAERVVVGISAAPGNIEVIQRAARLAQWSGGELHGVHVRVPNQSGDAADGLLDRHRRLLMEMGGTYHEVVGGDVSRALRRFAEVEGATQLVMGATRGPRWHRVVRRSIVEVVTRQPGPLDVHVVDWSTPPVHQRVPVGGRRPLLVAPRRRLASWLMATIGVALLTAALWPLRGDEGLPGLLLVYLLLVVAVAVVGGAWPAAAAAVAAFLAVNWFLVPPFHTLNVGNVQNLLALFTFLAVGAVVSFLVGQVARRSAEAVRARAEAEALARTAGALVGVDDPLPALVARVCATFELDAVAALTRQDGGWRVDASAGQPVPAMPSDGSTTIPVGDDTVLVLVGSGLQADDLRVLDAFAAQLATALDRRRLQAEAAAAIALGEADRLRTALLRAVSHDLRTPLASIKASVTSLLQRDVDWPAEAMEEFLATIDEETDRLNGLVGNLLDMGRLQAGAVTVVLRPVALESVVPAALASLSADTRSVDLALDERSPEVQADPALLERAVANVVSNALVWTRDGGGVRVTVDQDSEWVELRVVDQGPGVAPEERSRLFEPFQRLGDRSNDTGAGLGLAVARGFLEAMGGSVTMEDTPGGGLTVVLRLRPAP